MKAKILLIAILAFVFSTSQAGSFTKTLLRTTQFKSVIISTSTQYDSVFLGNFEGSDGNFYEAFGGGSYESGNVSYVVQTYGDEDPITGDPIYVDSGTNTGSYVDSLSFYNSVQVTFTGYCWF